MVTAYTLPPEKRAKRSIYARERNRLYFVAVRLWPRWCWAVCCTLRSRPRYRDWAERVTRVRFLQAYLFVPLLLLSLDLADLPLSMRYHRLPCSYEQSSSRGGRGSGIGRRGVVSFGVSGLLVWRLYEIIRRSPRRWWFYGWMAAVPLSSSWSWSSRWCSSRCSTSSSRWRARHAGAGRRDRAGDGTRRPRIPRDRMFEMMASEKLRSINAYVAGVARRSAWWCGTRRSRMSTPQTLFVFGHEMGHYVLDHMWVGMGGLADLYAVPPVRRARGARRLGDRDAGRFRVAAGAATGVRDFQLLRRAGGRIR